MLCISSVAIDCCFVIFFSVLLLFVDCCLFICFNMLFASCCVACCYVLFVDICLLWLAGIVLYCFFVDVGLLVVVVGCCWLLLVVVALVGCCSYCCVVVVVVISLPFFVFWLIHVCLWKKVMIIVRFCVQLMDLCRYKLAHDLHQILFFVC